MEQVTESYGDQPLDARAFIKAFIAALVKRGLVELRPHEPATRRGFSAVVEALDQEAEHLYAKAETKPEGRRLLALANALRPSNSGAYDGFESALRQVQLTFTSSPNPDYDEIAFSVPKLYANALIENLCESDRTFVLSAAQRFVEASGECGDELEQAEAAA